MNPLCQTCTTFPCYANLSTEHGRTCNLRTPKAGIEGTMMVYGERRQKRNPVEMQPMCPRHRVHQVQRVGRRARLLCL